MSLLKSQGRSPCERTEEHLSAYLDSQLSPAEQVEVRRHLEQCETCQHELELLRGTVSVLRTLPVVPAPRSFAIQSAPLKASSKWFPYFRAATAFAAIFLALLVAGDVLSGPVLSGARYAAAPPEAKSITRQTAAGQAPAAGTTSSGLAVAPSAEAPQVLAGEQGTPAPRATEGTIAAAAAPSSGTTPSTSGNRSLPGGGMENSSAATPAPNSPTQPGGSADLTGPVQGPGAQAAPSEATEPGQPRQENQEVGEPGLSLIRAAEVGLLALTILLAGGMLWARRGHRKTVL